MKNKKIKVALFGGSFDPPHTGHMQIIFKALEVLDIDKLIVMPNYLNPFKKSFSTPANIRYQWLKKIFFNLKKVEVSSFEIEKDRPVATIETVKYIYNRFNIEKLYLIIGADNLHNLHKWKKYNELKTMVDIVVATRDKIDIPKNLKILDISANISSTELREKINENMLPKEVKDDIKKFYKEKYAKKD